MSGSFPIYLVYRIYIPKLLQLLKKDLPNEALTNKRYVMKGTAIFIHDYLIQPVLDSDNFDFGRDTLRRRGQGSASDSLVYSMQAKPRLSVGYPNLCE